MDNPLSARNDPELTAWLKWQLQRGSIFQKGLAELAFNADLMQYSILRPALLTFAALNAADEETGDAEKPFEIYIGDRDSDSDSASWTRSSHANGFSCRTTIVKVIHTPQR